MALMLPFSNLQQTLQKRQRCKVAGAIALQRRLWCRLEIAPDKVLITLDLVACGIRSESGSGRRERAVIEVPDKRRRYGTAVKLVIDGQRPLSAQKQPDPTLVALVAKGRAWLHQFTREGKSIKEISAEANYSERYVNRVINIALLSPDILAKLERGDHPEGLSATR